MADEYRLVLPKQPQGGFSESPEQTVGNSSSPTLDSPLTVRNSIVIGVGIRAAKQMFNAGYTATVEQIGNSRLEEAVLITTKLITYGGIIIGGGPVGLVTAAVAATVEIGTLGIQTAVTNHAINLDNDRIQATRGTRVNFRAGGYYG